MRANALRIAAVASPLLIFLAVYGPAAGRGFISDDFGWIAASRVTSSREAIALFGQNHGFYRPLVALSFAGEYALFGLNARGYGFTNLALALACAMLIASLLRTLGFSWGAAGFGAALWLLNFHGINMAILWISGRTALLLTAGALLAMIGVLRARVLLALGGFALALFSKEESLALLVIFAAAYWLRLPVRQAPRVRLFVFLVGALALVLSYAALRVHSGALTPGTAPSYYRFTASPTVIARNVLEYSDRACSYAAAASVIAWMLLRPRRVEINRRVIVFGCVWLLAGFALTIWLPVRSSLYACFPAVGAAVIAVELCSGFWRAASRRREWALIALVVVPIVCAPLYVARNHRWTDLADFSSRVLNDVADHADALRGRPWLILIDDRRQRVNIESAFGALVTDAVSLKTGLPVHVWVEPPLGTAALAGMTPPCAECPVVRLAVRDGRLVSVQ
jgi:hypothetical protein